ncbi:hypothetical protein [Streptomyces sp. RKND-216]|uniref:hypothetical protein n=1 Tax=Streptomyces sp. RKND-216 TaxID=2562581 RepID=UPI0014476484|nr:hypothetical protein [Streptomyces sp. RKND-216]
MNYTPACVTASARWWSETDPTASLTNAHSFEDIPTVTGRSEFDDVREGKIVTGTSWRNHPRHWLASGDCAPMAADVLAEPSARFAELCLFSERWSYCHMS